MKKRIREKPVLMIALDAAEVSLIEEWMADGTMPNLRTLRDRGAFGRLASPADWFAGAPWPTFYTGTLPPEHGFYFHLMWRPELMKYHRPRPDWLPLESFHRRLGELGLNTFVFDLPLAYPAETPRGVEILSWVAHDKLVETSIQPPDLARRMDARFGREVFPLDSGGLHRVGELLWLRDRLLRATEQQAEVCRMVLTENDFDFALICFGATHRGGHKFWNRTILEGDVPLEEGAAFDGALREIYAASDRAIGDLVESVPDRATIIVTALHGMEANQGCTGLLPAMLQRVLGADRTDGGAVNRHPLLGRMREAIPLGWRAAVKSRLRGDLQDRLSLFWRSHGGDWNRTRAFVLLGDLEGAVNVNLRGREAKGVVEAGAEFEELCEEIITGLRTFVDAGSGEPAVADIAYSRDLYPEADHRRHLPDLVVQWTPIAVGDRTALVSPEFGTIAWPLPGHPLEGYAGHHIAEGWVIAAGDGIQAGARIENGHILDLNATIHALLDVPQAPGMRGRVLPELAGR